MALTLDQRRERLRQRAAELEPWRVRARAAIDGWTCDGAPLAVGAPWPAIDGLRRFAASAQAPADWPLEETRLALELGGESLVTLSYADGRGALRARSLSRGIPAARPRLRHRGRERRARRRSASRSSAPALARAEFVWIDAPVEALLPAADADRRGGGDAGRRRGRPASSRGRRGGVAGARLAFAHRRLRRAHRADPPDADGLAAAAGRRRPAGARRRRARQRRGGGSGAARAAEGAAGAISAARPDRADRPRPYRSGVAVALR